MGMFIMLFIAEVFSTILQRIFCNNTLDKRVNNKYFDFIVWSGYFLVFNLATYAIADFAGNVWVNLLIFVSTFFITVRILYSNPVRTLTAVTAFMYLGGMCSELLVYYGKEWLPETFGRESDLLCTILSKIVLFFIIKLTSALVKMRRVQLDIQDCLEVFIVPVGSIWILLSIFIADTGNIYIDSIVNYKADVSVAEYFAGEGGRVIEIQVPASELHPQTLVESSEQEYLIFNGTR